MSIWENDKTVTDTIVIFIAGIRITLFYNLSIYNE